MAASNIVYIDMSGGQSNDDGRNDGLPEVANPDGTVTGITMYNYSTGLMAPMQYGVNGGAFTNTSVSFGFDVYAWKTFLAYKGGSLYVLKASRGGTSMAANANTTGSWSPDVPNILAGASVMAFQMKERMERVRAIYANQDIVAIFRSLIWHQGEGDSSFPYNSAYTTNFLSFFDELMKWTWNPNFKMIIGTVPTNSAQYSATVRSQMNNIVAARPNNISLVDVGAPTLMDGVHWDAAASKSIGNNLYGPKLIELFP